MTGLLLSTKYNIQFHSCFLFPSLSIAFCLCLSNNIIWYALIDCSIFSESSSDMALMWWMSIEIITLGCALLLFSRWWRSIRPRETTGLIKRVPYKYVRLCFFATFAGTCNSIPARPLHRLSISDSPSIHRHHSRIVFQSSEKRRIDLTLDSGVCVYVVDEAITPQSNVHHHMQASVCLAR